MKNIFLILVALFSITNSVAQTEETAITVNVSNINKVKGTLVIGLYDSEANFMKKQVMGKLTEVTATKATITFEAVKPGNYAISLFHDENDNKKFDTYLFGIPKEDYGCSNNAKGKMGPPKWEDAVFSVNKENVTQNIKL